MIARVVALGLATVGVAACHAHISIGNQVSASTVEQQIATELAAKLHVTAPSVTCPGGLDAKVGATETCSLTLQGASKTYSVLVTVNSVSNNVAHFSIQLESPDA